MTSLKEDVYKSYSEEYADEEDEEYVRKMRIERQVFLSLLWEHRMFKFVKINCHLSFMSAQKRD